MAKYLSFWVLKLSGFCVLKNSLLRNQLGELLELCLHCIQARSHCDRFGLLEVEGDRLPGHIAGGLPSGLADVLNLNHPVWWNAGSNVGLLGHEIIKGGGDVALVVPHRCEPVNSVNQTGTIPPLRGRPK